MSIEAKEKELEVLKAEAAFAEKKAKGQERYDKEVAAAFKKAETPEEFDRLVRKLDPPVSMKDKLALRELRRDFRENHRTPKTGAQPGTTKTKAKVK